MEDFDVDFAAADRMNFLIDTIRENKELNEYNRVYLNQMNVYLRAFINLTSVLQERNPTYTWPMANEMGDEELGREIAEDWVNGLLKTKPKTKKKK